MTNSRRALRPNDTGPAYRGDLVKKLISVILTLTLLSLIAAPVSAAADPLCVSPSNAGSGGSFLSRIVSGIISFFSRAEAFFRKLLGNPPLDIPAEPPETIPAPDDGTEMRLVWNDEFNGDSLDGAKWSLRAKMRQSDVINSTDKRNVTVENGELVMRTWKEPDGKYSTNTSVTTDGTMSFRFGYLEIYANVPFVEGGWPSFWMSTKDVHRAADYMAEIDMFEIYDTKNTVSSDIHKWYPGTDEHYHAGGRDWSYTFKRSVNLNNEYHLYGFGWTSDELYFTVDGRIYKRYDLSRDFGDRNDGMQGFRDPVYIIFNNFIFTEESAWKLPPVNDKTRWPITYKIDWVRLYQKDGEGQIFDDTGY